MNARIAGACGSAAVHVALLVGLLVTPPQPAAEQSTPVRGEREGEDIAMQLVATTDGSDGLNCERSYRGIGIAHWNNVINEVVAGGPAERAGAKVGDVLLNDSVFMRDQYPVGHRLPLRVQRQGEQIELVVHVGRVCYSVAHTIPHLSETDR